MYHGHKNRQKDENSMFFIDIHPDLNLAPIRFVQFVPRFFPRCPLYSFIISMSEMLIVRHLGTPNSGFNGCHCIRDPVLYRSME